ncbi:MAG: hypothetical protein ACK4RT_05480 [Erythrobacter sp.]
MPFGQSILNLSASGLYGCVLLACLAAAITARGSRQLPGHIWTWVLLALFFTALIPLRLLEIEEAVRDALRAAMRAEGSYRERRDIQGPIVAAIILLAGCGSLALLYHTMHNVRGRRNVARVVALVAALSMLLLMVLRMISLHAVDALLYGPVKLNWVVDLGTSLTVLVAAVYYVRLLRRQP